ncbi:MAG: S1 RNA-binding domain-containing protein [Patescibacteria group bacterium]
MSPSATVTDTMANLVEELGSAIIPFRQGDIAEVEVIGVSKQRVLVNVADLALGFVPQREFSPDSSQLEPGRKVLGYVLVPENEDGFVVLSLKRADRERLWRTISEQMETGAILSVKVTSANKGGLVIDYGGIEGFLPLSQLSSGQYAKLVAGGDLEGKLRQIVGQTIRVKILSFDERNRKLIFSEKAVGSAETEARIHELKVGDKIEGTITGIVDYGLFVDISELEGLVHISELAWERVNDIRKLYKVGEKVMVSVIGVEENRVSLSIKRLQPDPWQEAVKTYQVGQRVTGEVTRLTQFGAFVRLDAIVEGLVHVSEILPRTTDGTDANIASVLTSGERYPFIVLSIEPTSHRISLSYRSAQANAPATKDAA